MQGQSAPDLGAGISPILEPDKSNLLIHQWQRCEIEAFVHEAAQSTKALPDRA
jgi:hypothetical protein